MADQGLTVNPFTTSVGDGLNPTFSAGRGGELLVAECHGKYFHAAARGALFSFNVAAVTVPVVAATLVSVFSLYNPVGSNRLLELVDVDISTVVAATVVDTMSLYISSPVLTAKGTFTTAGTALPGLLNSGLAGQGVPYSAYTHSGTPTKWMAVAMFGATSTTSNQISHYVFDGKAVIPPGSIVSLATASAAATTSGTHAGITWLETAIV